MVTKWRTTWPRRIASRTEASERARGEGVFAGLQLVRRAGDLGGER